MKSPKLSPNHKKEKPMFEQNKFSKHDAAKAAQRSNRISRADAEERRDKLRETWVSPTRSQPQGSLLLDQKTLALKESLRAEQRKAEPKVEPMATSTLLAVLEAWLRRNPSFYDSDFNGVSMRNFLLKAWHEKGVAPSIELLDSAYSWLMANGHIETDPRIPRRRGDVAGASAPRIFEYATPEQTQELEQKSASEAVEKRQREDDANRALSFEELQQKARASRGVINRERIMAYQG
jgi:hypothetical protein